MNFIIKVWETEEERKFGECNRIPAPEELTSPDELIIWAKNLFQKKDYACIEIESYSSEEGGVIYNISSEGEKYYYPYESDLPVFKLGSKLYFLDRRLKQLRNVYNPNDFADINFVLDNAITFGLCPEDEYDRKIVSYLEELVML